MTHGELDDGEVAARELARHHRARLSAGKGYRGAHAALPLPQLRDVERRAARVQAVVHPSAELPAQAGVSAGFETQPLADMRAALTCCHFSPHGSHIRALRLSSGRQTLSTPPGRSAALHGKLSLQKIPCALRLDVTRVARLVDVPVCAEPEEQVASDHGRSGGGVRDCRQVWGIAGVEREVELYWSLHCDLPRQMHA